MKVKYKERYFILEVTKSGFRIRPEDKERWEYVKKEYIFRLCSLLNATFGYNGEPGRVKINIPIEKREGIPLTKQRPIIWNTAVCINLLYPEITYIDKGFIVSSDIIRTEKYEEALKKMLVKGETEINIKSTQIKPDEKQFSIEEFVKGGFE